MKYKTTKKNLNSNYYYIISIGYCDLQHLLQYRDANSYCSRAEGWACDKYDVDGTLISTGYSPIKASNTKRDYDTIREYDNKALEIISDYSIGWEEQKEKVEVLLKEFISKCKEKN